MITGRNPKSSKTVKSFSDALDFIQETSKENSDKQVFYRGHGNSSWRVWPSLFRQNPDISQFEDELIRELICLFPQEFASDQSMFDKLVRMQHYGLPTRLLDVTSNPLVALYFAVDPDEGDDNDGAVIIFLADKTRQKYYDSDVVSCLANLANLKQDERAILSESKATTVAKFNELEAAKRLVQFIKSEKPYFENKIRKVDLFRPINVYPKRANQRMLAQAGQFITFGLEAKDGPIYEKNNTMIKMTISSDAKLDIREKLDQLNIDGSSLFPEIDKAARRVKERFLKFATNSASVL